MEDWGMQNKMEKKGDWVASKVKCRGFYKEDRKMEKAMKAIKAESQNFSDPVLANLNLTIKLGFRNTDLG